MAERMIFRSAHAICSELGSVNFYFKWTHRDGSTVEFNPSDWASDDPLKADWLLKMNELYSSKPAICPVVRFWLREFCELIDFQCSERTEANSPRIPALSFPRSRQLASDCGQAPACLR